MVDITVTGKPYLGLLVLTSPGQMFFYIDNVIYIWDKPNRLNEEANSTEQLSVRLPGLLGFPDC